MSWWGWGAPKQTRGKPRIYSTSAIAKAGTNSLKFILPKAGRITRVELDAQAVTEYFKSVDCKVFSPKGGHVIRLVSGQLLPDYDARLVEHLDLSIQDQSEVLATFRDMTAAVVLWVQIAIVEDD